MIWLCAEGLSSSRKYDETLYPEKNKSVVMLRNETCWEMKQGNLMSSVENWIALEREIETSLVSTQTLISSGWPADCINIRLLFESHRYEIWTWVRALQVDREVLSNTPPPLLGHTHTNTHSDTFGLASTPFGTRWPLALLNFLPDAGQTSKALWTLYIWEPKCLHNLLFVISDVLMSIHNKFMLPYGYQVMCNINM